MTATIQSVCDQTMHDQTPCRTQAVQRTGKTVREEDVIEFARLMVTTPSPPGHERPLAERLALEGQLIAPDLEWRVDPFDGVRANLLVTAGPADYGAVKFMLFAHLDTSLASADEYRLLTGHVPDPGAYESPHLELRDGKLIGPGIAVTKGPAAGALAALLAASRAGTLAPGTGVLLTSGGTHRTLPDRNDFAAGLHRALKCGLWPDSAVNVKAGAPGVLHEEPGSAYLRISVHTWGGPLMLQSDDGCSGAAATLARLLPAIESWRKDLRSRDPGTLCGRDVGLGAVTAGMTDKPDMLASVGHADLSLITVPDDDVLDLASELAEILADAKPDGCDAEVSVTASMPAGRTSPDHHVVALATDSWERHLGPSGPIVGWRGSTDGALLRHAGVPVARLGPRPRSAPAGCEALDLDELTTFARIDAELLVQLGHDACRDDRP